MKKISNRKAYHEYEILDTFEAGLVLLGHEVKSIKGGHMHLKGAYVILQKKEVFLVAAHIAPYKKASNIDDYDPYRTRKLLLNKKEIDKLFKTKSIKGLTIVPLSVYTKKGKIKVEIGIARGKTQSDKRATVKKRELDREARRHLMN